MLPTLKLNSHNWKKVLKMFATIGSWTYLGGPDGHKYLHADRIPEHSIEVVIPRRGRVEKLSPQQLTVQRQRRIRFLYLGRQK